MIVATLAVAALLGIALAVRLLLKHPERALARFVDHAVLRLPSALQPRYTQEWRADLAALSARPAAALVWALGLRRASSALARASQPRRLPLTTLCQVVLDAGSLAFAYYAAFSLRFGADTPHAYDQLLQRTLPAAVVGGLLCLAVVGAYGRRAALANVLGGVALATLVVIAYVALAQPVLVSSARGLTALTVPAGVCVVFALSAGLLVLVSRVGLRIADRS
jgi:hypothetical protein